MLMTEPETTPDGRRIFKVPDYLDEHGIPTCPKCGCQDQEVTHSYGWNGGAKKRRRVCSNCDYVFPPSVETFDETA